MLSKLHLSQMTVMVILGMSLTTYATKASGLWLLGQIDISQRAEAGLEMLPGAVIMAILGPELARAGPPEWIAGLVVVIIAWRTDNILFALVGGVGTVLLVRGGI